MALKTYTREIFMLYCERGVQLLTCDGDPKYQAEIRINSNFYAVIRSVESKDTENKFSVHKVGLLSIEDKDNAHPDDYPEGKRYILKVRDGEGAEFLIYEVDCFYLEENAIRESNSRNEEIDAFYEYLRSKIPNSAIELIISLIQYDIENESVIDDWKDHFMDNLGVESYKVLKNRAERLLDMHPPYWC